MALPIEKKLIIFEDKRYLLFFSLISATFSFTESILPRPFIFIKLGFAYIPILLVIDKLKPDSIIIIVFLKSLVAGFFSGTLFSFTGLLSIIGSLGSIFAYILICFFISKLSKIAISIWLSIFTNLFQLLFYGYFIINDLNLLKLIPFINIISIFTGFLTASIAIEIEKNYLEIKFIDKMKNKKKIIKIVFIEK